MARTLRSIPNGEGMYLPQNAICDTDHRGTILWRRYVSAKGWDEMELTSRNSLMEKWRICHRVGWLGADPWDPR